MAETWIVAVDQSYYPQVETFDNESDARAAFDDLRNEDYLSHVAIYIGKIEKATHRRQQDFGWQPVVPDDPDRDGYCRFCRDQQLPEDQWT